jgi:L-aspartate oxidase
MAPAYSFDVLIIGSGGAGLGLALQLPEHLQVAVLSKSRLEEGCTLYAQGGISAVTGPGDSIDSHVEDTLKAGAGLNKPEVVRFAVGKGAEAIHWLTDLGVPFTRQPGGQGQTEFHLTREGGHSTRRILHAADATGRAIENTLLSRARQRANITLFEHHIAVDLITASKLGQMENRCLGAYVASRDTSRCLRRAMWCWPPAVPARSTCIPATRTPPVATASPWPGEPAAASPTSSSTSSTPPACFIPRPSPSW